MQLIIKQFHSLAHKEMFSVEDLRRRCGENVARSVLAMAPLQVNTRRVWPAR